MPDLIPIGPVTDDGEKRECEALVFFGRRLCGRPVRFLDYPSEANPLGTYLCEKHAQTVEAAYRRATTQ